jgi:hypothetical protein
MSRGLIAFFGIALPYATIAVAWSTAPASFREHYDPQGDTVRTTVGATVLASVLIGLLLALPWVRCRSRSAIWWFGAGLVLIFHLLAVVVFNFCFYGMVGGAFP